MIPKLPITIGILMGFLFGITLWAADNSLSTASLILYKNPYTLTFWTVFAVMAMAFAVLFSYQFWEPKIREYMQDFVESLQEQDDYE